jgi:RNA 3'-terminal phosphate cyclase
MPDVIGFEKATGSSRFTVDMGGGAVQVHVFRDGQLEDYMEAYGLQAADVVTMVLLDALDDSVDVPPYLAPGMRDQVDAILKKASRLRWKTDRDQAVAKMQVPPGSEIAAAWRTRRLQAEALVAGHQRRQEELRAEDHVQALVDDRQSRGALAGRLGALASVQVRDQMMRVEW